MEETVLYAQDGPIATLTLNRPDRLNAWTPEMGSLYFDLLDRAAEDPDVRVIVVTGTGRAFCAGADMEVLRAIGVGEEERSRDVRRQTYTLSIPKPVIAMINGPVAGIGLIMALMCDIRFAATGAKVTTAFARRGLIAEHGVSWLLPRLLGPARALDLLLSGRTFLTDEAATLGLVNRVFEPEALAEETYAYARDIAENCSPRSLSVIKREVWSHLDKDLPDALEEASNLMVESMKHDDFREGVASYMEKRPPRFAGVGRPKVPTP
ncbi:MAG TPA: enoyl-CoA hydratase [Candidatus Dormibacteraeota bacterium]